MRIKLLTLFIILSAFAVSFFVYKHFFSKKLNPICPSDFAETDAGDEARMSALDKWTNNFYDTHPGASMGDWAEARHQFWIDNNCTEELRGYDDYKSGNADPEKVSIINKIIQDYFGNASSATNNKSTDEDTNVEDDPIEQLKVVNMPASEVDEKNIYTTFGFGSLEDADWESALVDIGSTTKEYTPATFPTDKYTSDPAPLPPTKTLKQIRQDVETNMKSMPEAPNSVDEFTSGYAIEDNFKAYPVASRFLPDLYTSTVNQIDVDSDGKKETVVEFCDPVRNHPCVVKIIIIKGDKIIFTIDEPGRNLMYLVKANDSNGFYLKWFPDDGIFGKSGYCCPLGYRTTRFKLVDGKFVPVSEAETMFAKVVNADNKTD